MQPAPDPPADPPSSRARGFTPPPPRLATGSSNQTLAPDPTIARLIARHEALQRELDQGELAASPENPWIEQIALVDQAIAAVDAELSTNQTPAPRDPIDLPDTSIEVISVQPEPPSSVHLQIGDRTFVFEEEIDWAERGTNIVRGDLELTSGDVTGYAARLGLSQHDAEKLALSLFALATELRDQALASASKVAPARVSDLLQPCPECGDLRLWNGVCLACEARRAKQLQLEDERKRLFDERDAIFKIRESVLEQLPTLRRRFAESAAALERALGQTGNR